MRPLRIAINTYGLTKHLKDGSVRVAGYDLELVDIEARFGGMRGLVRSLDFDIAEMPFASYLCARDAGKSLTAIPVFVTRNFHHASIACNVASGIGGPKDLEGRTVGVNRGYTVTTAVWARGILKADYGVDLSSITWAITDEEHIAEYKLPSNVDASHKGENLVDLLRRGVVPAAVGEMGRIDSPNVRPLIPDAWEAGGRFFERTGIYPINHGIFLKTALVEEEPALAGALFDAFKASRDLYAAELEAGAATSRADQLALDYGRVVGEPFPFGIEANRKALDALLDYATDQQVIGRRWQIDELFAPAALALA